MLKKLPILQRVTNYYNLTPNNDRLEWISGKWFLNQNEIKNPRTYLVKCNQIKTLDPQMQQFELYSAKEMDEWLENYRVVYEANEPEKLWWYPSKYCRKGKELSESVDTLPALPFELDPKQLTIIGVMLFKPKEKVMFITTGIADSGKSTFGNIVQQLFDNDVAACSLSDLSNEFNVASAIEHRLIYSDEISSDELNSSCIKQLCAKEKINANHKNQEPYTVQSQSALLFNCNKNPNIDIEDTGMLKRTIYYCRNKKIAKPILELKDKQYNEEELIIIAAHAYRTLRDDWRMNFEKETYEQLVCNNNVYRYWRYVEDEKKRGHNITHSYNSSRFMDNSSYVEYCREKGLKPCGEPKYLRIIDYIEEKEIQFLKEELL